MTKDDDRDEQMFVEDGEGEVRMPSQNAVDAGREIAEIIARRGISHVGLIVDEEGVPLPVTCQNPAAARWTKVQDAFREASEVLGGLVDGDFQRVH